MKLSYSMEDVERWRNKTYRRTNRLPVTNERQALAFINSVGFCLAANCDGLELPNLWDAVASGHSSLGNGKANGSSGRSYYLSYAWAIQSILPNHNSVFYGKIFKRRPSLISRDYFPYFYALSARTGERDEYKAEHAMGKLSPLAKKIMDTLLQSSPITTKELRSAAAGKATKSSPAFERALDELQRKLFISRVVGNGSQFGAEWAPVVKCFPVEVRKARKISAEHACATLLEKYFQVQLISSVEAIHNVFGWSRQTIFHSIGLLVHGGVITPIVSLEGRRGNYYCLVH